MNVCAHVRFFCCNGFPEVELLGQCCPCKQPLMNTATFQVTWLHIWVPQLSHLPEAQERVPPGWATAAAHQGAQLGWKEAQQFENLTCQLSCSA